MSHLAEVHHRQAQSFIRAGKPERAVELLEKARMLVRDDVDLRRLVLSDLVDAYDATGQYDRAARWREELARIAPAAAAQHTPGGVGRPLRPVGGRGSRAWLVSGLIAAGIVLCGGAAWLAVHLAKPEGPKVVLLAATTPAETAASRPTLSPNSRVRPARAESPTTAAAAEPATRPADPDGTKVDRQQLLKDNVGLVIVVLQYEGTVERRVRRIDVPLGMGTAFAVHPTGVMLTNRHVVEAGRPSDIPPTLAEAGLPTMTLRGTTYLVCFGPTPREQFPAKLMHKSDQFDIAVLKVKRPFAQTMTLASTAVRQGDDILCCGFPGAITQALNRAANTPSKVLGVSRKWQQTGHIDPLDQFSADSFNSTLTRGIVSAAERNVGGVAYLQMDAAISPGNSGGPVLNSANEVVGIATFGLRGESTPGSNYNFALLLEQAKEELEPYLKGN